MNNAPNSDLKNSEENKKKSNGRRNKIIVAISILFLLIAIAAWLVWLFFFSFYESTENAYVGGNPIQISSRQKGTIIALYADDTDLVHEGQLLAKLDPTDYAISYEMQKTSLALAARQVQQLWDDVVVKQAALNSTKAKLALAKEQFEDRAALIEKGAISQEEYEQYRTSNETAMADNEIALAQLNEALDLRGNSSKETHPQIIDGKLRLFNAYIALQRCFIYAPQTGYIAQRSCQVGQNISSDLPLMSVVPLNEVWVDANFKETQLANVRIGQSALVTADIYGSSHKIRGKVIGFIPGTGSVFSLLPPQNATGNWIKIIQRLPVRIALACEDLINFPLFIGLSTTVEIDTRDTSGVMISSTPSTEQIAGTCTYQVSVEPVFSIIDTILKENFSNESTQ